jgi:hypothetical protein
MSGARWRSIGIADLPVFRRGDRVDFFSGARLLIVSFPPRPTRKPQNGQSNRSSFHPRTRRACRQFSVGLCFGRRGRTRAHPALRRRDPSREVGERFGGANGTGLRVMNILAVKTDAGDSELHTA